MWWYRDTKRAPSAARPAGSAARPGRDAPAPASAPVLATAVQAALPNGAADPDAWLLMSLLVDTKIELEDGTSVAPLTASDAERTIAAALEGKGAVRLYNRFVRDFGESYTRRDDLPAAHRESLERLRAALAGTPGVRAVSQPVSPAGSPASP